MQHGDDRRSEKWESKRIPVAYRVYAEPVIYQLNICFSYIRKQSNRVKIQTSERGFGSRDSFLLAYAAAARSREQQSSN